MKILVLAGGSDQIALINELHKRDIYVILVDYFDNPPAKKYADKFIKESTLNVEAVKSIAINEKVDLLTTACTDQALLTVAKISEDLGLSSYISYQTALNVTNKSYMKKVMIDNNIPTSRYAITNTFETEEIKKFEYPLVVKPVDCNSSKGVRKVINENELKKYLNEAIELSRTKTAIVEEFKEGEELSVDFYVEGKSAKFLCATKSNKIKNTDSFTIIQSYYPVIDAFQINQLISIADNIVKSFNISDSPLFIQLITDGSKYNVLEFSARMGGGSKYKLIEVLTGVDIMKVYVDRILGSRPKILPSKQVEYSTMNYVYCYNGKFMSIEGLELMLKNNIIVEYFQYKAFGSEINNHITSSDRVIGFMCVADTKEEMQYKLHEADNLLKILDESGRDIMIHSIYSLYE